MIEKEKEERESQALSYRNIHSAPSPEVLQHSAIFHTSLKQFSSQGLPALGGSSVLYLRALEDLGFLLQNLMEALFCLNPDQQARCHLEA